MGSGLSLEIRITGTKETEIKLRRLAQSLYNFKNPFTDIGKEAARYYSGIGFASQGGVFGRSWPALSPEYAIRKRKIWGNRPLLVASGDMQEGFEYEATRSTVIVSNATGYFKYHQSTAPRSKIPRRAMMAINEPIKRMIRDRIRDDIRQKIGAA